MNRASLGKLRPSRLGLGCMVLTRAYGTVDAAASRATMHRALEVGITLFDTADAYANGDNETFVGKMIRGHRDQILLSTKFGLRGAVGLGRSVDGRPEYVHTACDASLERLGVDHIDLYYQHRVDPEVPIEDTVGAMAELVGAGKVSAIGLSEPTADEIARAHGVHPITAVQSEWSLWARGIESEVVATCRELGIGIVAYAPLGRGFLTGALAAEMLDADDLRSLDPRLSGDNLLRNLAMLDTLRGVAAMADATPAQVALAWLLSQGEDVIPIPGVDRVQWLDEDLGALDLHLDRAMLDTLDAAFAPGATAGNPDAVLLRDRGDRQESI